MPTLNKTHQFNIGYFLLTLFLVIALQSWLAAYNAIQIPYSDFQRYLAQGNIKEVVVTDNRIEGEFVSMLNGKMQFVVNRIDSDLIAQLDEAGVKYSGRPESQLIANLFSWVVPALVFFGVWMLLFRKFADKQGLGGMMNVGKSKAKVYVETDTGVRFSDVAGVDDAELELQEVVNFLKDKEKYGTLGAHVPKGILLVGPPGTGKTLLARAVAGEANVPFYSISGSEFVEMFVGVGAARVRDLFQQARENVPCIIFIDELDALGRARGTGSFGGHDEKEQTLNQLLSELDGFDPHVGIVLLAATNRPEILDPALLRAGRFDRQVIVDRPDRLGRVAIIRVHLSKIRAGGDVDPEKIAGLTPGFTGADLANLINEAAIIATRRGAHNVTLQDFTEAVERIVAGTEKKSRLMNAKERERVAYHEMGHALTAATLPDMDPVHKVSIIPRSIGALGYTLQRPTEDRFLITTQELENRMTVLLAGRASEDLIFGQISTGAADDLVKVTDIAREMVTRFGMDEVLGHAVLEASRTRFLTEAAVKNTSRDYSEQTAREVDLAIRKLIDSAYHRALDILKSRMKELQSGATLLLEKETLNPQDFPALLPAIEQTATAVIHEIDTVSESNSA